MAIKIRPESNEEYSRTEEVVKKAFLNEEMSDHQEHRLVQKLRNSEAFIPELSLVAIGQHENILGHLMLTTNKIINENDTVESLSLAPVSVLPEYQYKGIGSQLIKEGIKRAKELGYKSIIVLGHPEYYPKFGFHPASFWNIKAPYDVPDEVFMALELQTDALENVQGIVQYPKAFEE